MTRYYILIKRKGSAKWLGAIPAKRGASKTSIRALMRKQLKKGFTFKIISEPALRRLTAGMSRKRRKSGRRIKRRKMRRTKTRRKRRR